MNASTSPEELVTPQAVPARDMAPRDMAPLDLAALLAGSALLATGPLFVRLADTGPVASAFWRMALALPILFLAALRVSPGALSGKARTPWPVLVGSGVFFAFDLASWHLGIMHTKLANATLFGNSASLIYPVYGFVIARAWPSRQQGLALALAALGGALLMGRSYELSTQNLIGDLLSFAAGVFYAVYFAMIAKAREALPPMPLLAASTLASAVPLLLVALAMGEKVWPTTWWPLVALALCSQVVGQGLMVYALGRLSPLVIGLGLLIQPIISAIIGWMLFSERLTMIDGVGAILVALALVLVRQGKSADQ